jgi:hypothetical protein
MKTYTFLLTAILCLLFIGWTTACQTTAPAVTANTNQAANKSANQAEVKTTPNTAQSPGASTDNSSALQLGTPTQAYKTAYAARQAKDVAKMKQTFSKEMLLIFSVIGESDNKTVEDELKEMAGEPQASTDESRNEKIAGDMATLEYPDAKGKWKIMNFVKEGSDWKLAPPDKNAPAGGADADTK